MIRTHIFRSPLVFCLTLALAIMILLSVSASMADAPCTACHAETAKSHATSSHGKLDVNCASCHGAGKAHLKSPSADNIRTFTSEPVAEQVKVCTACHSGNYGNKASAHGGSNVSCVSCHSVHGRDDNGDDDDDNAKVSDWLDRPAGHDALSAGSAMCFDCHRETFAQFDFNERHRLLRGDIDCTSCHDPHSVRLDSKLGGFGQSLCGDCHADAQGPFVFEHAASRVEGCVACHEPHGSPNRHMLKIQEVGALCYSCHADVPQFHVGFAPNAPPRFDQSTVCTNCHVSIHGSNHDRSFLR